MLVGDYIHSTYVIKYYSFVPFHFLVEAAKTLHFWFGEPYYSLPDDTTQYTLLTQESYILAYDLQNKLPAFTSATLLAVSLNFYFGNTDICNHDFFVNFVI